MNKNQLAEEGFQQWQYCSKDFLYDVCKHNCVNRISEQLIVSHYHSSFELIVMERGSGSFCIGGQEVILNAGMYAIVSPGMIHGGIAEEGAGFHCILFSTLLFEYGKNTQNVYYNQTIAPLLAGVHIWMPLSDKKSNVYALCQKVIEQVSKTDSSQLKIIALLYEILDGLIKGHRVVSRQETLSANRVEKYVRNAMDYIHEHIEEEISSRDIAQYLNLNLQYFCHCFTSQVGIPPVQYIQNIRIRMAQTLLRNRDMSISEVAYKCGFKSICYFNKVFRKITGETPGSFLKKDTFFQ